jgi:hypothetical protein
MATGSVLLRPGAADLPDGTASNAAPGFSRFKSSATAPGPYTVRAQFDATTREQLMWTFRMPADYASAPVVVAQFAMTSATTGNVILEARIAAITPGDATDIDTKAFAAANTSATTAVAATAGFVKEISITMTNADSLAAGDQVTLYLARDAANASDTATGDLELISAALTYTTV